MADLGHPQLGPLPGSTGQDLGRHGIRHAAVERIATGCRWTEGPVWFGDLRCLVFSDTPNDRLLRWDEPTGTVGVLRQPCHNANGNTRDRAGRLVSCEHRTRRVTRTGYDGQVQVLADRFDGLPLNSPNDVVVGSDGSVWFTDPTYGIDTDYEGRRATAQLPTAVYRLAPDGTLSVVSTELEQPNGLCLSPDESVLYVADSGSAPAVHRFEVPAGARDDGVHHGGARYAGVLARLGGADGIRCDEDGNVWAAAAGGVRVLSPAGATLGGIDLPEPCSNLCFGAAAGNRLFITATSSVYALYVNTRGV